MDVTTYKSVFGQFPNSCLTPHWNIPCHNLTSLDSIAELYNSQNDPDEISNFENDSEGNVVAPRHKLLTDFPCHKTFDYRASLSCVVFPGSCLKDEAESLVREKCQWSYKLKSLKPKNASTAINHLKSFHKKKTNKLPLDVMIYLRHIHKDPEPKFYGNYNWMYTGGNVSCFLYNNDLILSGANKIGNDNVVTLIKLDEDFDNIVQESNFTLRKEAPILQISCRVKDEDFLVCSRQKNYLTLFSVDSQLHPSPLWMKKVRKDKFLTSSDISCKGEYVAVTDCNHDINIFDVSTSKKVFGGWSSCFEDEDSWNQILFNDCDLYFANRKAFHLLDKREGKTQPSFIFSPENFTEKCEVIYNIFKCNKDNKNVYIATNHNLILLDFRNVKALQRWTHLMESGPQFGKSITLRNEELIVLQSKQQLEGVGIINEFYEDNEEVKFLSKSMPCALRNINETLEEAHFKGICLNPLARARLNFSVTGIDLVKNEYRNEIHLFVTNSAGDISMSKLTKKQHSSERQDDYHSINLAMTSMEKYESHISSLQVNPIVHATHGSDMKSAYEILGQKDLKRKKYKVSEWQWPYREMHSFESLSFYRDPLGKKLLKEWRVLYCLYFWSHSKSGLWSVNRKHQILALCVILGRVFEYLKMRKLNINLMFSIYPFWKASKNANDFASRYAEEEEVLKGLKRKKYKVPEWQWPYSEMHSFESLRLYTDPLGRRILKEWRMEEKDAFEHLDNPEDGAEKVRSWLNQI